MQHKIEKLYNHFKKYPFVSTDSRSIKPNSLFFALRGENFNGNKYALSAIENGASFAVVDDPDIVKDERFILVEDALDVLQKLALFHRRHVKATVIGITGSNGKTTTKELIARILAEKYKTIATKGNLNNHIGVPLTLLSIPADAEFAVVEMGANHVGEIAKLSEISRPDYGIITNIGRAHLEGFGDFEGVIQAKSELYHFLRRNNKKAFLNLDNDLLTWNSKGIDNISYGENKDADFRGELKVVFPFVGLRFYDKENEFDLNSNLTGKYNFENILAAAAIGTYFKVPPEKVKIAVENYKPDNNRSQVIITGNNTLILDAYNANPTSMMAAISSFAESGYDNKIIVLGEMLELGKYSKEEHIRVAELVYQFSFERVYFVGKHYREKYLDNGKYYNTTQELLVDIERNPLKNKTVLIKGSRGNKLEQLYNLL